MDRLRLPTRDAGTAVTAQTHARRTPDELLRDAWAIRHLLDDLDDHEHDLRIRLIMARDDLRLEAARQWRDHGWRPITDEF